MMKNPIRLFVVVLFLQGGFSKAQDPWSIETKNISASNYTGVSVSN